MPSEANAKKEIPEKRRSTQKASASGSSKEQSSDFVLFNQSFNRRGSLLSSQSGAPSTSRVSYRGDTKSGNISNISVPNEEFLTSSLASGLLKLRSRNLKSLQSGDSTEGLSENLLLKNTDEIINIDLDTNLDDGSVQQCTAERLRLGDDLQSISEITTKSDSLFTDDLFDEICVDTKGAEPIRFDNTSHSYVTFQSPENTIQQSAALTTRNEKAKKQLSNFWSPSFFANKTQIVGFFYKSKKKKKKEKKKKRTKESDISHTRFLDPPVSFEEDLETKEYLKNLYFYILQLAIFTTIALSMMSANMFYFTHITKQLFFEEVRAHANNTLPVVDPGVESAPQKPLSKARTVTDFWNYAETTLLNLLYWNFYYSKLDPSFHSIQDDKKMFNENQILGVARLRQIRVENLSCKIHPHVQRFFDDCYSYYSVFSEDTKPIKEGMENNATATAWVYSGARKINSTSYWGKLAIYGGGGYYLDLSSSKLDSLNMIKELRRNRWLGKATRAIFIDFTIYNANVNLFCVCKLVLEFPPVGGIITSADFRSLKLIRYLSGYDFFILACEITYLIFLLLNFANIVSQLYYRRAAYFYYMWNYMDLVLFLLTLIYIALNISREVLMDKFTVQLEERYTEYTEVGHLRDLQMAFDAITGLMLFFGWVKLFSFLNFNKALLQFRETLRRSLREMVLFIPMFATMFIAFAFLSYLLFGGEVEEFHTIWSCFLSLLKAFLGEFNYSQLFSTHRILGPLFYTAFVFFIFFVLVNVFIAIINEAYSVIRSQVIQSAPRAGNYVKRAVANLSTCFRPMKKRKLFCRALKKRILFCEIEKALRRAGFQHEEIQIFFHKYNINCRNFLDDGTKTRILKDLELKSINFPETSHQFQINLLRKKVDDYNERMDLWESKLQPIVDKVDILLHRL